MMNGMELSRGYWTEYGKPMLAERFPELMDRLAAGLTGSGSECYGFDDDVSRDHDFDPGFCLFVPADLPGTTVFQLERAYAGLPKEYMGISRQRLNPVGGNRKGVITTADFYKEKTGFAAGPETLTDWLRVPLYALAEAVNGEIFYDGAGEVTAIRRRLAHMPADVIYKRIAGNLLLMAQSGQYNYNRCLAHRDSAAAQLAVFEFVKAAMNVIFLLNGCYTPYYKWCFQAYAKLPLLGGFGPQLEYLLTTGNSEEFSDFKYETIEELAGAVIAELQNKGMTEAICGDLEKHAYSVNDRIENAELRNMHILAAV